MDLLPFHSWNKMALLYPEHKDYVFWNKNKSVIQGTHTIKVHFCVWADSKNGKALNIFFEVEGIKLRVFVGWWTKAFQECPKKYDYFTANFSNNFDIVLNH